MLYATIGIFCFLLVLLFFLWIKERTQRKNAEVQEKELDKQLTKYIAGNIDLEKTLSEIRKKYAEQQDMSEEIKKTQIQSRLLKHDMKNHSLVILSYLEEGNVEAAKDYTSKLLDNLNKMYTYINIGNSLMNYIINHKLSKAKEQGITIKAEIENLAFDYMDSVDFSALLNNLLDNAIEAAIQSREKKMEVIISNRKGFDSIIVKNSIDNFVLEKNPDLKSTKSEEGHGFGLIQIRTITEKYQGMIDIFEENNLFIVQVVYPC